MYLTTEGLVLREMPYQETSRLLVVLTREYGLLTFKARGVNRRSSRIKASCQLLAYSEFTVHENKGFYTIYEAEVRELFPALRSDLELLSLGSYFAQLLELISQSDSISPELLTLGLSGLYALSYRMRPQKLVKAAFELRLLCLAGYTPRLEECVACGNPYPDAFCIETGELFCSQCSRAEGKEIFLLDGGALMAMRYIVQCELRKVFSFTLGDSSLKLLAEAVEGYVLAQLQRGFSTLDFYKSIL